MDYKKPDNENDFLEFKKGVLSSLKNLIDTLCGNDDSKSYKKGVLLVYWLRDYIGYIKQERTFKPKFLPKYPQGSIIDVNFGFRVGSELGGRHYAIVLDRKNSKESQTITVVPLSSLKNERQKKLKYNVLLGESLYNLMVAKIKMQKYENSKEFLNLIKVDANLSKEEAATSIKKVQELTLAQDKALKRLYKLKKGSFASLGQITTISKMRIMDPLHPTDSLYNIKLPKEEFDKISARIKSLYLT